MVTRFCFKCGKKMEKLKDGYCKECYKISKIKKEKKDTKEYLVCTKCGYMKIGREWTLEHKKDVKIKKIVCEVCSRRFGDYFEAVIQFRGEYTDKHILFCEKFLEKLEAGKDRMAFHYMSGSEKELNMKIGSKKAAKKVALLMREKFGCELKYSYTIHSRRGGIDIVRDTILLRF